MQPPGSQSPPKSHVCVSLVRDHEGHPKYFTLTLGHETIPLDPGKSWAKADAYKWVTRGLIEAPQSFHVLPNGEVDLNGEKIRPDDPEGAPRLEAEINKHHLPTPSSRPSPPRASAAAPASPDAPTAPNRIQFRVHLDHFGHFLIEARRGPDRTETGLRGLQTLVHNGLMTQPGTFHVDPLQRALEIDGHRYECNEAGARDLEQALNDRYAPRLETHGDQQIEIRDNPASPTGYDIAFPSLLAGARVTSKGHLSQEKLEILSDERKCDLIRPGIILRIAAPLLLFRRRRPDGGEEHIPDLPDLDYLRNTAAVLESALNHPALRRRSGPQPAPGPVAEDHPHYSALKIGRNSMNRALLWLDCYADSSRRPDGKALTHHNIADLQHHHVFQPHLDVALSLDNRTLSLLNLTTREETHLTLSPQSGDAELAEASLLLTNALRPATPP